MTADLNFDDYFLNHSYLSEEWLRTLLLDYRENFASAWNSDLEQQLQDEERHARMCRNILLQRACLITDDTKYSLAEVFYKGVGGLDLRVVHSDWQLNAICLLIERRAHFLYKMYLRYGRDEEYKKIIAMILEDEMRHNVVHDEQVRKTNSPYYLSLQSMDRFVFGDYLNKKYLSTQSGRHVFLNVEFWRDIFNDKIC